MARAPFTIGAVVAMAREARLVRRAAAAADVDPQVLVACRGIGPQRAREAALSLAESGASLLLSTGYAGGLGAGVHAGDLLFPEWVANGEGVVAPIRAQHATQLGDALGACARTHAGGLTSSAHVVSSVAGKRALAAASGAAGVDMESAAVVAVGHQRNIPVLVIRGVSDSVDHAVPRSALHATDDRGRVSTLRLLRALVQRPGDLPALLCLARGVRSADRSLGLALERVLPLLLRLDADALYEGVESRRLRYPSPRSKPPS